MTEWERLNQLLAAEYDVTKYYLGKVCKKGKHKFHNSPFSFRYNQNGGCLECDNARIRPKEQRQKTVKTYYENHKTECLEANKIWAENNREKVRQIARDSEKRKRVRKLNNTVEYFTEDDLIRRYRLEFNRNCAYCGCFLFYEAVWWDHVLAASKGGSHTLDNLVPTCAACNLSKYTKDVFVWLAEKNYPTPAWLKK